MLDAAVFVVSKGPFFYIPCFGFMSLFTFMDPKFKPLRAKKRCLLVNTVKQIHLRVGGKKSPDKITNLGLYIQ